MFLASRKRMTKSIEEKQKMAIRYYDKLSYVYDFVSNWYYTKPRNFAIKKLEIQKNEVILNLPCGTGVNFKYFQKHLKNTGSVLGIDLSEGMLKQASKKITKNNWKNIFLVKEDATNINKEWYRQFSETKRLNGVDVVFCDLGLSGLPEWQSIIDNMIAILKPNGRIAIMDWYLENPGLRGEVIKWIGKGEVTRPIYQYLETKIDKFEVDTSFCQGGVFVAYGAKLK